MRLSMYFSISLFFLCGVALAAVPLGTGPTFEELQRAADDGSNWLYHTHDYAGTRYSPLEQINRQNAVSLAPVCINQLGNESDFQTGPIIFDGVMYLTSGQDTLAINAANCLLLWRHTWEYQDISLTTVNRGVAIQDGYVVRGTSDGYLLAIDSLNGDLVWSQQVVKPADGEYFTMAPMIYDGSILIGPAGGNNGISGWVGAFNLLDGEQQWRFYTVPGATDNEIEIPINPLGVTIGGGTLWTPLSLDVENESLYVAVTNPAPNFSAVLGTGNNLYTNSILSLNVRTGELNWFKQLISDDDHGWDLTQVSPLFNTIIDNVERKFIATTGKDGILRLLDRDSQQQLFSSLLTVQKNVDAPVTLDGTYTCPGVLGGVLWNGPALEPREELLITPSINLCSTFYRSQEIRYIEGRNYFDGTAIPDPETLSGWLTAVDMKNGDLRWQYETELPLVAAVTTTAGGLVLSGEMSGDFLVLDSSDGNVLYRFNTGGAIGAGVVSYAVEGQQYIAVASGHPSELQVNGDMGAPTLIVFALPD
jgi:alcohol dehydrogenase (cytochrome c)